MARSVSAVVMLAMAVAASSSTYENWKNRGRADLPATSEAASRTFDLEHGFAR